MLKQININKHAIKLENDKQLFYELISSLKLIKLEILKNYIKTNLANDLIWPYMSFNSILILFV